MLGISDDLQADICAPFDLIQDKQAVRCISEHRTGICLIVIHPVTIHDPTKFQKHITDLIHQLIADRLTVKCILSKFYTSADKIYRADILFTGNLKYLRLTS